MELLPEGCDRIDMGKRGGQPSPPQSEINKLLVKLSREGRSVVRLKSGDPYVFGRTAAEVQALKEAGCPVEVVPGFSWLSQMSSQYCHFQGLNSVPPY